MSRFVGEMADEDEVAKKKREHHLPKVGVWSAVGRSTARAAQPQVLVHSVKDHAPNILGEQDSRAWAGVHLSDDLKHERRRSRARAARSSRAWTAWR